MSDYLWMGLIVLLALPIGYWFHSRDKRQLLPLLQQQATKRQGRVTAGSLLALPQLYLNVDGTELRVSSGSGSEDNGTFTCVRFPIAQAQLSELHVQERRNGLQAALDRVTLGSTYSLGDPRFEQRFQVRTGNPRQARVLLEQSGVMQYMLELPAGAELRVSRERAMLSIDGLPQNEAQLDQLINTASALLHSVDEAGVLNLRHD